MSRPTPVPVSIIDELWYQKLNTNFQQILNAPFPIFQLTADEGGGSEPNFTPDFDPLLVNEVSPYSFELIDDDDGWVYPTVSKSGGCYMKMTVAGTTNTSLYFGLKFQDPPNPPPVFGQDYSFEADVASSVYKYGVSQGTFYYVGIGDTLELLYEGTLVSIFHNGTLVYSDTTLAGQDAVPYLWMRRDGNAYSDVEIYTSKPSSGDVVILNDARLFQNCIGVYDGILYVSNGTSWNRAPQALLSILADLVPGVATIQDIQDAFNALLADMRTKNWLT